MLTAIDAGAGNIQSVVKALTRIGATPVIATDACGVVRADAQILAGAGSRYAARPACLDVPGWRMGQGQPLGLMRSCR